MSQMRHTSPERLSWMGWRLSVQAGHLVLTKWGEPDRRWECELQNLPTREQPAELIFREAAEP
jgi:hypothetical protein